MKIVVNHTIAENGDIVVSVDSEKRQECCASVGTAADAQEFAYQMAVITVLGLLRQATPEKGKKNANRKPNTGRTYDRYAKEKQAIDEQ